ncbi:hypothetical protein J7T55_005332 [Diaporthe amygdali]|uniref:uncharacterized protein n=1 Tax=Phomopsis amygdali TaxID=1214568 RepID=UPI0022FEB3CA|nr:uncharacterized protein J7T55_005332 [Diaporthe amygdali]KAJ0108355.1 hypothetical protein J7T55_005332 [Diaporthe amygdali]
MSDSAPTEGCLRRTIFAIFSQERALGLSLENDLHPLYQLFNFRASALTHDTTGEDDNEPFLDMRVHERMLPAFRLATHLIDFSLPFYAKVFCADLVFNGDRYAFDLAYNSTDEDIRRVRALLVEWAGRTRFYCRTPFNPSSTDEATTEVRTAGGQFPTPARTLTNINVNTIEFFSQENYDAIDAETKTARLVQLAFVLVHEQAHAVFHHRWAEDASMSESSRAFISRVSPIEPLYHVHIDPRYHEFGFALQAWIHGGSVLNRGKDLVFVRYPGDVLGESTVAQRYTFRSILFNPAFWRVVQNAPRPSTWWDGDDLPLGWLGQAMGEFAS